jgi:hypothetical protein
MSLFSEQLVEEYYNRRRYLTIRGARQGVGETDILAVRFQDELVEGLHIEVQTSFRPVAFLSNGNAGAGNRTDEQVDAEMQIWIQRKYLSPAKVALRQNVWPGITWRHIFVHARLKDPRELNSLRSAGVELLTFEDVLRDITLPTKKGGFTASAGGDVSEILRFYGDTHRHAQ